MKKITSLFCAILMASSFVFAAEGGTLTSNPNPIVPNSSVTINYDGTGTNFANWTPACHIHAWLTAKTGETFSKSYSTPWAACSGDVQYAALDAKVKMTHDGVPNSGKYSITIASLNAFFNVAEVDKAKIGTLGVIVRTQYEGGSNQTVDFLLSVGEVPVAIDKFNLAYGVEGASGWAFVDFIKNGVDPNKYEAITTIPTDFSTLSCYVGWNEGGFGNANWTNANGGLSKTILLSTVSNIKSGQVKFFIFKDATVDNWNLAIDLGTTNYKVNDTHITVVALDGCIDARFAGKAQVEIYTPAGQLIHSSLVENKFIQAVKRGAYLVRINGQTHKVLVR